MPSRPIKLTDQQRADLPRCAYCGKPLKLLTHTVTQPIGEDTPQIGGTFTTANSQHTIKAVSVTWYDNEGWQNRKQHTEIWAGAFYRTYGHFERLDCAKRFANAAYDAGYRITKK